MYNQNPYTGDMPYNQIPVGYPIPPPSGLTLIAQVCKAILAFMFLSNRNIDPYFCR